MDTQHTYILTAEALAFGEWLSRVAVPSLLRDRRDTDASHAAAMDVEDVVVASADYTAAAEDEVSLKSGDIVEVLDTKTGLGSKPVADSSLDVEATLLDTSAAKHKLAVRPKKKHPKGKGKKNGERWLVRVIDDMQGGELCTRQGWVPAGVLQEKQSLERDNTSLAARRQAVVRELIETEEEFGRDMQQVVTRYMRPMDKATTPKPVFENRELLFSSFKQICEFHNTVLLEGIKYYADEPKMLGRALLRMEREFDKHVAYCRDEPRAQHLLQEPLVHKYFQALADKLGDDKGITEHLKLPIQRINDYQLLLKELVKYSTRLNEDCTDLQKALELFLGVPNRATDNKFISSIEGFRGNIHKLGRLLTHDWFTVTEADGKARERYLFLFKARILVSKVKRVSDDRSVFVLKDIIKLPEVEIKDTGEPLKFELHLKSTSSAVTLTAHKEQVKTNWLTEIRKYASDVVALAEHAADDLQVLPSETESEAKPAELKEVTDAKDKAAEPKRKAETGAEEQAPEAKRKAAEDKVAESKVTSSEAKETKKREHTEVTETEKKEFEEKRSRVDKVEETVLTREESLEQLKAKRKASIEAGVAAKVSKTEVVAISSVSEAQESSAVTVQSCEVTTDLATKSLVTASSKVESQSVTSQSISQETVKAAESQTLQVVQKITSQQSDKEVKTSSVEETVKSAVKEASSSSAEVSENVLEGSQTVTAEEANDEMSRYNRSSRLSGEYSSSSRKLSSGGRYESSSTYDSTGLSYSSRRESGTRIESGRYESGGSIEGTAASRYESKYSSSSRTEGGSKVGIESSYETKTEGSNYAIESDTTSKLDSIAAKYGIESKKSETSVDYDSTAVSKIDSIASKYGRGDSYEGASIERRSSKYGRGDSYEGASTERRTSKLSIETSLEGSKVEGASSNIQRSYESSKNGSSYESATSKTAIANGSVSTGEYQSIKSVSKSESRDGKPVFTKTLEGATIEPGENAIFECKLKDSSEAVKVTWLKDNKPLNDRLMDRCSISLSENDHKLELMHCREDDTGVYTAMAENTKGNSHCTAQLVVYELTPEERRERNSLNAPYFLVALKDTEIMENTYLRFMIRVKGEPNPDVKFYRDGKEIVSTSISDRISIIRTRADKGCYELVIPNVTPADAGDYSCKAINIYGECTTEAKVTVVDDKNIFFELPPGGEGLLAKGEKPTFSWKRDGQNFDPEERFKVLLGDDEDSLALVFQHVRPEDAGLYTCVAKTSTGNISCSAELTVQGAINELHREPEKPTLVIEHRDAIVSAGASAMLELQCKGFPKPSIQFKHDGKIIEADTRHKFLYEDDESMSLVIKNVTASDAGEYHVTATNELGEDTTTMKLIVKQPPKIKKVENQSCMAGSTHTVTVEVEGAPAPDVSFYKDGVEVKSSERIKIIKDSEYIYRIVITDARITDTGSYSVVAKNEVSQCSDFWQWHVTSPPRVTKTMGGSKVCDEKDVVTFKVETESDPAPTVKWFRNKTEVTESSSYKMTSSGSAHSLVITSAARADAGEYSCEIGNIHGSVSDSCVLSVRGGPVFTRKLRDRAAGAGDTNIEFTVDIEAYPEPSVKWFLGDVEITEKKSVFTRVDSGNTHKIILKEVSAELAGQYTCKVSNDLGSDSCSATFTVNRQPRITKSLVDMTVDAGKTLKLDVEVEGCPEPKVKWFKDGKEVSTDARIRIERDTQRLENYHLTVTLVKEEDGGEYEVRAENEFGTVSSKSTVTVHTKEVHSRITKQDIVENELDDESTKTKLALEEEVEKSDKQSGKKDKSKAETIEEKSFWDDEEDGRAKTVKINSIEKPETEKAMKSKSEPEIAEEKSFWDDDDDKEKLIIIEEMEKRKIKAQKSVTEPEKVKEQSVWDNDDDSKVKKPIIEEIQSPKIKAQKSVSEPEEIEEKSFWDDDDDRKSKTAIIEEVQSPKIKAQKSVTEPDQIEEKSFWDDVNDGKTTKPKIDEAKEPKEAKVTKSELEAKISEDKSIWDENHNEQYKKPIVEEVAIEKKKGEKGVTTSEKVQDVSIEEDLKSPKRKSVKKEPLEEPLSAGIEAPPTLGESTLKDSKVYETLPLMFTVVADGNPKPVVRWLHDGQEVKPCKRVHITNDGNLYKIEIDAVNLKDAGKWQCEISNDLGKNVLNAELTVAPESDLRKPNFTTPLEAQSVMQREPVTMQAVCTADPEPHVSWLLNGVELTPDATVLTSAEQKDIDHGLKECTFKLNIPTGRHADTGEYTIKATNKYGVGECSARLDILLRPEIEGLKDVIGVPFEETMFIANVRANPIAEVKWSKDGYTVKPSSNIEIIEDIPNETYKLVVKKVGVDDAGTYILTAKNEIGETAQQARLSVHTGEPVFTKTISKQTIKDYDDCTLKVRCDGVPSPDVTWFRNDEEVKNDESHIITTVVKGAVDSELEIKHFKASDSGKYKVRALNIAGEATCEALVEIARTSPGFAHKLDRSKEVDEGEPLELKAKMDGSPIPTAKWYKDGAPLPASDPRVVQTSLPDGTVKLTIEHVTPADCGAYKLLITNPHGEHAAQCAVAVNPLPRKPSFCQELVNVKAVVGQPLKLEARVMAFPAPEVKWFKDGLPVRPSQAVNFINSPGGLIGLQIENCKPEDAGMYLLTVSNKLGEAASKAHADVSQKERKPAFIAELQPAKVIEGFPARLEVKILGHPQPKVKWTHNGEEIVPDGQRIKVVSQPDGTHALLLSEAVAADAGKWGVIATNDAGVTASNADLLVASRTDDANPQERPHLSHGLRDMTAEEGQPLTISVPFVGNPVPEVTWTKDGQPLKPSERVQLTCDGKRVGLEINPVETPDAGVYGVKLVNPLGEDSSEGNIVVRKVYQPPKFSQKFSDLQQLPTFDAKFPARVLGIPNPDITWYKNGSPLTPSEKYNVKRDGDAVCLYVRDLKLEDAGKYKCIARNREGEAECEANLEVVDKIARKQKMEPPSFLKKIGDIEVFRGMSAKFTACATGSPEPDVEWYRNDERLFPCERIRMDKETTGLLRLTISGVDPTDVGAYRCRIYNPHGEESCTAQLTYDTLDFQKDKRPISDQYSDFDKMKKTGIPMPLADRPIISRMADRHLTLSWKPSIPHGPRFPVTYQVEMCEVPDGDWFTARTGLRSCACDVRNLQPFRDYKLRVRVENKYGVSDPSPFAVTHRDKINPDPPKFVPYLEPGIDFRPDTSPYFPRDFDIERPPHDGQAQAPRFLRQEHDSQYGVKGHNASLFWFVYGYPKPKMTYLYNDEPVEIGGRYDWSYTRNGQATLFINKMLERDAGWYEAVATNEHGQARQRVRLELAEYPAFTRRPEESVVLQRRTVRIEARVTGVPYPDIKWYKDWQPLAASTRIKMSFVEPDLCILCIHDAILKDEGLYSISARNVAGSVSSSAMLHVEESEHEYSDRIREHPPRIKASSKPFGDYYDLGDELGRGVQGAVYHAAERLTGRNYAAKIMHGHSALKPFMKNELDILNILNDRHLIRLHDAYEHEHTLALVLELAAGGELVRDRLLRSQGYTEREIAGYMRQLLRGLKHMHDNSVAHLGLTIGELLLSHAGSDELKLCDFGLSRRIQFSKHATLDYGMPEYVAPEVANGEGVSFASDMWSLGIITYILLSGHSPFRGVNDMETLDRVKEGRWEWHDEVWWSRLSRECRDFISKLLVTSWHERLDVDAALAHPWLGLADKIYQEEYHITTDRLRNYYNLYKDWTSNAECRTWFRRRPLSGAYTHPSKMVYPPGEIYTPEGTPDRSMHDRKPNNFDLNFKQWDHPDWEVSAKSESHYQNGPDTYLLQLRDTQFPVRLREYMKVACGRSPAYNLAVHDLYDPRTPIIRERRRFTDIMDEEIDDEQRERINNYGAESYTIRRLRHELGTRLDSYAEAQALMEAKRDGRLPFFREKPQVLPVREGEVAQLTCLAVGEPEPTVQWFKNDCVIAEGQRIKIFKDEEGRSTLRFEPAAHHDIGYYKVVARNKVGQTVARTMIVEATNPDAPDSPAAAEVADSEVLLRWKQPKYDGNSPVLCYSLQYKEGDSVEWKTVAENIDHEFFVVKHLAPDTSYQFRLSSRNRIGWSDKGIPTNLVKTKPAGCPKIEVTKAMKHLQALTESGQQIVLEEDRPKLSYSTEESPIEWSTTPLMDKYSFISELGRGRFSIVVKGVEIDTNKVVVSKILETRPETEVQVQREFECLRRLRHERIANLLAAYQLPGSGVCALVMEKLQGADILTYLSSRHEYSEQLVATVVTQLLDALQYIHWRGYCHLDLQPDNVVMSSVRSVQVKLVDFGSAHKVNKLGTVVPQVGELEYKAPEIVNDEPAYPQTDVWSLGVLTYVLLSGRSPFRGEDDAQTKQNITFVRYRFEHLYKEITQEATRFLMFVFKRVPLKRPLPEECHEHRWLAQSSFMNKKRERALFLGNRLKEFSEEYHARLSRGASQSDAAALAFGNTPRMLARSNSIQEELLTNFASH